MESKIIQFGTDYKYDYKKSSLENWGNAKKHFAKQGIDIGDFPEMTEEDEKLLAKQIENIR